MAREKYRLQALLTIRTRAKKQAEAALGFAIKKLMAARDKLKKLKEEKEEIVQKRKDSRAKMTREMVGGASIFDGNVHTNYLRKLKEDEEAKEKEIEEQKEVVKECEEAVSLARREYIDASKQLQIMEKHKELWRKKVENEISKKEEKELNEIGNILYQLRKMKSGETEV